MRFSLLIRLLCPPTRGALIAMQALALAACGGTPTAPAATSTPQARTLQAHLLDPQTLPFHGAITGRLLAVQPAPPGRCPDELPLLATYHGDGVVMPMGEVSVEGGECLSQDDGDPESLRGGAGDFTFTAVSGDVIGLGYDQTELATSPPWILRSAHMRISRGTGRFAGASLAGVTWTGGSDPASGEMWAKLDGSILYWPDTRSPHRRHRPE